jgi:hypothetical protein
VYYESEKLGNLYHTIDHVAAIKMNEWNEIRDLNGHNTSITWACLTVLQTQPLPSRPTNRGVSNILHTISNGSGLEFGELRRSHLETVVQTLSGGLFSGSKVSRVGENPINSNRYSETTRGSSLGRENRLGEADSDG